MPEAVNGTNPTVAPGNAPANFEQMLAEALRNGSATACEIGIILFKSLFFIFEPEYRILKFHFLQEIP